MNVLKSGQKRGGSGTTLRRWASTTGFVGSTSEREGELGRQAIATGSAWGKAKPENRPEVAQVYLR